MPLAPNEYDTTVDAGSSVGWWRVVIVLLGVLGLLVGYYWVHKPFDAGLALHLGGMLLDVITVTSLFVAGGALGSKLLSRLDWSALSRAERAALEVLVGLAAMSVAMLLLGLVGLFYGIALWAFIAMLLLVLRGETRRWLVSMRAVLMSVRVPNGWSKLYAAVVSVLLTLALVLALTPPVAWDALNYHLVAPARYLAAGRIVAAPDNFFLGFPQLVEVLFGVTMSAFGRDTTAALVQFGFGAFGLLTLAGLVRRHTDEVGGWLTIILPLSATSFWLQFGWAYVDLAAFAYGAIVLCLLSVWSERGGTGWLVVIGIALGSAAAVKYTAGLLAFGVLIAIIARRRGRSLRPLLVVAATALAAFSPWLLKGALLYGNPVYPFLFGGLNWDAESAATFSTTGKGMLATSNAWQLIFLPLSATIWGVEKGASYGFTSGPWLLTASLLLVLGWRWLLSAARRLALTCAIVGLPMLLVWIVMAAFTAIGVQTRLMAAALPIAAVSGALALSGLSRWPRKPVYVAFIVHALVAATLLLTLVEASRLTLNQGALDYFFNHVSRDAYEDARLGAYAGAMRALAALPQGSEVVFLWEPRTYGCPASISCQGDLLINRWARTYDDTHSPDEAIEKLRASGADYLLYWAAGHQEYLADPRLGSANEAFYKVQDTLHLVWTDGIRYTLYQLATE